MRTCSHPDGCDRPHKGHGYCLAHLSRLKITGDVGRASIGPLTPLERFWGKVQTGGPDDCWEWTGRCNHGGYGILTVDGRQERAHRISARLAGMDVDELCVLHACDNPPCVNPQHLFLGTRADNNADKVSKGRVPHGDSAPRSLLTAAAVSEIRTRLQGGATQKSVAAEYGCDPSNISKIAHGHSWATTLPEASNA